MSNSFVPEEEKSKPRLAQRQPISKAPEQPLDASQISEPDELISDELRQERINSAQQEPSPIVGVDQIRLEQVSSDSDAKPDKKAESRSPDLTVLDLPPSQPQNDLCASDEDLGYTWEQLDIHVTRLREICETDKFLSSDFGFDCINQIYFLDQVEKIADTLAPEELDQLRQTRSALKTHSKILCLQYEMFQICIEVINFLIHEWHILSEIEIKFDHKNDAGMEVIKILDAEAVRSHIVSMEILWMTCENSPLRYMYDALIDDIPDIQRGLMSLMNAIVNMVLKPKTDARTFMQQRCDVLNLSKTGLLKRKIKSKLCEYVTAYHSFEKKVLYELYKCTALYLDYAL